MPARAPELSKNSQAALRQLGQQLRERRKMLGISATLSAEAAGVSRVTLYRIEKGEGSVAMSAYVCVIHSLGLLFKLVDKIYQKSKNKMPNEKIPEKIRIAEYPQLKRLAWQLRKTKTLNPMEALDLYERNWRHVDVKAMSSREQKFLNTLLVAFGRERLLF